MDCSHLAKSLGKIECRIQELLGCCKFPGLAIGIRYRQQTVFRQVYGVRDCNCNPLEFNSQFQYANASIPFLALWAAYKAQQEKWCPNQPLWTLGDIRFLGPEVAFTGTLSDILSHQISDKIYEGYAGSLEAWKSSHNGHDIDFTQLNPTHGSFSSNALSILRGLEQESEVKTENYELIQELAQLLAKHLSIDLTTELLDFTHNYLGLTSIRYGQDEYLAAPNPALNQVDCKSNHCASKKCGCSSKQCCWECKYTFDGDNWYAALGASGTLDDMLAVVELVLSGGFLNGQEKICKSALDDFLAPRVRALNQPECGQWFYSLGWKTRFYNGFEFIYNEAFLETGGRVLNFMVPSHDFGVTILTNNLTPAPEALAAYAFYLIVCNDCKEAEREFELAWKSVTRYINLNKDNSAQYDPPTGLGELVIDPTGTWINGHFGNLIVTKDNGQYKFQYKDFLPTVGQHLIANVWRFYYDDKHGINRLFQVNFTYNALFQAELAHAFTNDTQFTMTLQANSQCHACNYLCGDYKKDCTCIAAANGTGGCPSSSKCVYDKCGCCYRGKSCCPTGCNSKNGGNNSNQTTNRSTTRNTSRSTVQSSSRAITNTGTQNGIVTPITASSSISSSTSSISTRSNNIVGFNSNTEVNLPSSFNLPRINTALTPSTRCQTCQRKPCRCANIQKSILQRR